MGEVLGDVVLSDLLPGTWRLAATNMPMWLDGTRLSPRHSYELVGTEPLVFGDDVGFITPEGEEKHVVGTDTWRHGRFVWRGKGWQRIWPTRWTVSGVSADDSVMVIHFDRSRATPAGVEIRVRDGVHHPELRKLVARDTENLGLTPEDFASLTWLAAG